MENTKDSFAQIKNDTFRAADFIGSKSDSLDVSSPLNVLKAAIDKIGELANRSNQPQNPMVSSMAQNENSPIVVEANPVSFDLKVKDGSINLQSPSLNDKELANVGMTVATRVVSTPGISMNDANLKTQLPDEMSARSRGTGGITTSVSLSAEFGGASNPNCKSYEGEVSISSPDGNKVAPVRAEICYSPKL